jgi:transposase
MTEERIELSQRERDKLKVLHEVERGHIGQREAGERLCLSVRQVRRLLARIASEGDGAIVHRLRGRQSNRKMAGEREQQILDLLRRRYADFGPTLASEHLARQGLEISRETVRQWMMRAELWKPKRRRIKAVHVWRERRSALGELVMMDSSPFKWLEDRGPQLQLIAMIDDATSRIWGRFSEHDSAEENMRTLQGWLRRYGRPVALYTDRNTIFHLARQPGVEEQLKGQPKALTQIGRALAELDIRLIAARSPQAKGRIERLFATLQDRLVKEMRLAGIHHIEEANQFLEQVFIPSWEERFIVEARQKQDAHRPLGKEHRLEQILSSRYARTVASDYTVRWRGQAWAIPRTEVSAGLRGARIEVEHRLDGSIWGKYRKSYLTMRQCTEAVRSSAIPSGPRPSGIADERKTEPKKKYIPPSDHPWRRTFLSGKKTDISTLR